MILKTELFEHQRHAYQKLSKLKVGALYMEMGTGKTRTALELIFKRVTERKIDHVVWLCPCSVKTNLRRDIAKHAQNTDSLIDICGIETLSSSYRENKRLWDIVNGTRCYLIVDESNLVKNPLAIRTRNITRLAQVCRYKLILNGTPISRNEADLFAQWYILDWRILGYKSYWSFSANHLEFDEKYSGRVRRVLNTDYLTDKIAPYTYQISKDDCLDLPSKQYLPHFFSMTYEQREEYLRVKETFLDTEILDRDSDAMLFKTFTALQQVTSGREITTSPLAPTKHQPIFKSPLSNPRIQMLLYVVGNLGVEEQAVILCKFTHEIYDVKQALESEYGTGCVSLFFGDLSQKKRQQQLDNFESGVRFLVGNKACAGYGLNLQYCHVLILYNNDWDWATRAQAEDRMHRIGQDHRLQIIDICAERSIDERILDCNSRKESLSDGFKAELNKKNGNVIDWIDGGSNDTDRAERKTEAG